MLVDRKRCLGQVAGVRATDLSVERAKERGLAAVSVRELTHLGALGYYTHRAAEQGCISLVVQNGPAFVPPYGGVTGMFSTNPFSYAVPAGRHADVVYDVGDLGAAISSGSFLTAGMAVMPCSMRTL